MNRLEGKTAVVVGGHDGIGGAIAERFASEGATVYATSRRAGHGEKAHGEGVLRAHRIDAPLCSKRTKRWLTEASCLQDQQGTLGRSGA